MAVLNMNKVIMGANPIGFDLEALTSVLAVDFSSEAVLLLVFNL